MKFQYKYYIFSTIIGLVMIGLSFNHMAVQEPAATQIEKNLKQEYDLIPVFPEASLIESTASHKSDHARVGGIFSSKQEFKVIREYYDKELTNKGWKFYKETEKTVPYKEHNYEARALYYRKGDYVVSIENPGMFDKEETFSFDVTWGLEH